jgi:hypothetical protein
MTRLEDLQPTAAVRGILPDQVVTVVSVQWFGSEALELTYKGPSGRVANELLYRHDEPRLEAVEHGRPWSFDGDGHLFRLPSARAWARGSTQDAAPALPSPTTTVPPFDVALKSNCEKSKGRRMQPWLAG